MTPKSIKLKMCLNYPIIITVSTYYIQVIICNLFQFYYKNPALKPTFSKFSQTQRKTNAAAALSALTDYLVNETRPDINFPQKLR